MRPVKKSSASSAFKGLLAGEQRRECAICRVKLKQRTAHLDHCHATGLTRSLLCRKCNTGLGNFSDDPARLQRAITYLAYHRMRHQWFYGDIPWGEGWLLPIWPIYIGDYTSKDFEPAYLQSDVHGLDGDQTLTYTDATEKERAAIAEQARKAKSGLHRALSRRD